MLNSDIIKDRIAQEVLRLNQSLQNSTDESLQKIIRREGEWTLEWVIQVLERNGILFDSIRFRRKIDGPDRVLFNLGDLVEVNEELIGDLSPKATALWPYPDKGARGKVTSFDYSDFAGQIVCVSFRDPMYMPRWYSDSSVSHDSSTRTLRKVEENG